uniref:Basic salivary proline-rich protein 4 n=1 Tax=Phallusia mammillata TaxID=59560 RepID=A0A6F9DQ56_9ASCI|nr:basic salivary proline-rich protein 4 [Phallusia mammillata]
MYPYHRPGQNRPPPPPVPQSYRPQPAYPQMNRPPPQNYSQQTFHDPSFDDDEWSDCSDEGQIDTPYSSATGYNRQGYQPDARNHWDNPPPPIPPNNRQMPMPISRPPALPSKNDMDDVYLPIDSEFENSEVGKGHPNKPPPLPPNSFMHGQMGRPPMEVPQRPPKRFDPPQAFDQQVQDVYEQEDRPQRQPPQPPVPSPRPSPTSSMKQPQLDRHQQKSRDSGYGEPFSRNNSAKTHTPARVGSNDSYSSGEAEHEPLRPPSMRNDGISLLPQQKFRKVGSGVLPPMPPIKPPPAAAPRPREDPASSTVKELSQILSRMKPPSPTQSPTTNLHQLPPTSPRKSFDRPKFTPNKPFPAAMPPHEPKSPKPFSEPPISAGRVPRRKNVEDQSWYHNVSRERAEEMVLKSGRNGCFLVRLGRGEDNPYTITGCGGNSSCYNLRIRKRDDHQYALGSKKQHERTFPSVCDLVEYYKTSPVTLANAEGSVTLTGPP